MILGIDIGGTRLKTGFVIDEMVTNKNNFETPKNLETFCELLKQIIERYLEVDSFNKVAFSVPGSVDESGTVFFGGAVSYLDGINLKDLIINMSILEGPQVTVENDAKAATLGEMTFGNLRQVRNGTAIILGTAVGMGICIDGQLYKGSHHQAGEISFWIRERAIYTPDSFIGMGLSAVNLIALLSRHLKVENDGPTVFRALKNSEDMIVQKIFSEYCEEIAIVCFNLQTILDIDKIVIGGGVSQQSYLIKAIQEAYKRLYMGTPVIQKTLKPILIEATKFKADANLIGAARKGTLKQ